MKIARAFVTCLGISLPHLLHTWSPLHPQPVTVESSLTYSTLSPLLLHCRQQPSGCMLTWSLLSMQRGRGKEKEEQRRKEKEEGGRREQTGNFSGISSYKGTDPLETVLFSWLCLTLNLLKAPSPNTIAYQHVNLGRDINIQSVTQFQNTGFPVEE